MTPDPIDDWSWFDEPPQTASDLDQREEARELALAFARCFNTGPGQAVLHHLREMTQRRFYGPDAPDAALRHLEGQRHFVAYIASMIERGENGG